MEEWFASLGTLGKALLACGAVGTTAFVLNFVLQVFASDLDSDIDTDVAHAGVHTHASSDLSFKVLSVQGLSAFFMMFGWTGLALHAQAGASAPTTLFVAAASGAFTVWVVRKIFSAVKRLQSVGTPDLRSALGVHGVVYLEIPPSGTGQVQVTIGGRERILSAVAPGEAELIATGATVRVTGTAAGKLLRVERVSGKGNA